MKLRTVSLAIAAAAVLVPTFGWTPAFADPPAAPALTVDSSVAGTVSGTVGSLDQPFVLVALVGASDSGAPTRTAVVLADGDTYSLPSWGYGAGTTVQAWACPTDTFVDADCSAAAVSDPFTPTDVALTPTWSTDTTVGPLDQVTLDLGDPGDTGGGELFGRWIDDNPAPQGAAFPVPHAGVTAVPVRDGLGTVHLDRCDNAQRDHCVEETVSDSYTVKKTATASIGAVTGVSDAAPTTTFDVTTTGAGTGSGSYTVTWHLEHGGTPVDGFGATSASAPLAGGVAQDVPLDATGLPKGDYTIVGTITVVDTDYGTYADIPMTGGTLHSSGDVTPPAITSITASPTKIYPLISGVSAYKSSTRITVAGAGGPEVETLRIYQKSTNTIVRALTLSKVDDTHWAATWNGRKSSGTVVPPGAYALKVRDAAGNFSPVVGTVAVSGYKLVSKTWTHTYTPAGTLASKYVGKCSTLRSPSLRGWYHSFGYYANTRCTSQTTTNSLISTVHAVILPKAVVYTDIRVSAYGGAARAKPASKAIIRYLTTSNDPDKLWSSDKVISATMGTHSGYTRSTKGLVFSDHSFGWGLYTGFGYQYDVKSFTIVLHYKVLG